MTFYSSLPVFLENAALRVVISPYAAPFVCALVLLIDAFITFFLFGEPCDCYY